MAGDRAGLAFGEFHPAEITSAARRSPLISRRGVVAASQPLAAAAGVEILRAGGSAADAAVATAAALNVTEPTSTGIGGDCFVLYYQAGSTPRVFALNGSGRAPAGLTLDLLRRQGFEHALPPFHAHTVTVPGACAAWCDLLERFGRLPRSAVFAPAIRLAEQGFPVAPLTAHYWEAGVKRQLGSAPGGRALTIDGRAPRPGETFHNHGLARTLRTVAEGGQDAFYQGAIAEAIAARVQQAGGYLTAADLAAHRTSWEQPIHTTYRGVRVWECPPNGQGLAALLGLNILSGFDLPSMHTSAGLAQRLHLEIEAMRLAFADTAWHIADPAFYPAPLAELLSPAYADQRRRLIDPRRATLDVQRGAPQAQSDTVYFSVVDDEGNACSFINSNYMGFGTGMVPEGWGFSLQNRGHNFSLDPQHPNALAPGKRPYHTIIPALATRVGPASAAAAYPAQPHEELLACFGVMGGFMQPQGHLQVLSALVDDALDPQAALDRARFCIEDGSAGGTVALESDLPTEVVETLSGMGHPVRVVSGHARALFGRGQVIWRSTSGGDASHPVWWAGSDGRADGCALSWI